MKMANKHKKRCLTLLVTREMQIKVTIRYHFMLTRMAILKKIIVTNIGEKMEEQEPSSIDGGNLKWYSQLGKQEVS